MQSDKFTLYFQDIEAAEEWQLKFNTHFGREKFELKWDDDPEIPANYMLVDTEDSAAEDVFEVFEMMGGVVASPVSDK